ncbi:MAG: transposase [Salinivirgaceae bacterium]|nr:transposase [Salinivirgaceae bacterium]
MGQKFTLKEGLPVINTHAAGIDVGDTQFDVAIYDGQGGHVSKKYGCFTSDLHGIVSDLVKSGINTVAMESTGVYWLNLYLLLEESGIEPYLVNAKHVKNVTGRKKKVIQMRFGYRNCTVAPCCRKVFNQKRKSGNCELMFIIEKSY